MVAYAKALEIDTLTGLASRIGIENFLRDQGDEEKRKIRVAALELAQFGDLNDSVGGELGDRIIATTAKRLSKIFGDAELIGRTNGDHFCMIFSGEIACEEILDKLKDFTQRPIAIRGQVIVLSVRIGFASSDEVEDLDLILNAAEVALHRAKTEKRKHLHYESGMTSDAKKNHRLENDLRLSLITKSVELHKALHNEEFKIYYQPIIDPSDGSIHSYEALLRWIHPKRGLISAAEFIPLAEKIQVIEVLSDWVLRTAMKDALQFPDNMNGARPSVNINISPLQFLNSKLLMKSSELALKESGLDPMLVVMEVTESATFESSMAETLCMLKSLGIKIALDDFGTGYSSLSQLTSLPIDFLKIDRSFIFDLGSADALKDQRAKNLYRAIFALSDAFSMSAIVEGVETGEQLGLIKSLGADFIQGFYYAKPMPLVDVVNFQVSN